MTLKCVISDLKASSEHIGEIYPVLLNRRFYRQLENTAERLGTTPNKLIYSAMLILFRNISINLSAHFSFHPSLHSLRYADTLKSLKKN